VDGPRPSRDDEFLDEEANEVRRSLGPDRRVAKNKNVGRRVQLNLSGDPIYIRRNDVRALVDEQSGLLPRMSARSASCAQGGLRHAQAESPATLWQAVQARATTHQRAQTSGRCTADSLLIVWQFQLPERWRRVREIDGLTSQSSPPPPHPPPIGCCIPEMQRLADRGLWSSRQETGPQQRRSSCSSIAKLPLLVNRDGSCATGNLR